MNDRMAQLPVLRNLKEKRSVFIALTKLRKFQFLFLSFNKIKKVSIFISFLICSLSSLFTLQLLF